MRLGASLAAVTLVVGCGRLGYDLVAEGTHGGPAGGETGGIGGGPTDGGGSGGTVAPGGSGGATAGSGGIDAAAAGAGGQPTTDAGTGGQAGAGGSDSGTYVCTPGARELCDGRDNNCDLVVDETGACPQGCTGRAWGNHGYMLCDNTSYNWWQAQTECETAGLVLARIDSIEENDFLAGFAFASRNGDVWVGGSDLGMEGDWRWTDGTPFWSGIAGDGGTAVGGAYTHWWAPAEPNGLNGAQNGEGDCLAISQVQGFWIDEGCNYYNRALCETP